MTSPLPKNRFLAIGECMAELSPTAQDGDYRLGFAGDAFNTSWYLARLAPDTDVSFLTAVGDDSLSGQMMDLFAQSGIKETYVQRLQNQTIGMYMISLQNGERSFHYWRGQSAAKKLADDPQKLATAFADNNVIYFSGITLAILSDKSRGDFLSALETAKTAGKTIVFDPNLRPRLWDTADAMTSAIMQGAAVSTIVLPSFEDEAEWFHDANPAATLARYKSLGIPTVIVKNGPEPVLYDHNGHIGEYRVAPITQVTDTTAAGDSFNAGFLARFGSGDIEWAIKGGAELAARVVQSRGALVAEATEMD